MREYEDEIDRMRARKNHKKEARAAWKKETMKPVEDPNRFWLDEENSDPEEFWPDEFGFDLEEEDWLDEEYPEIDEKEKPQKKRKSLDFWDEDLQEISLDEAPSQKKPEIQVVSFEKSQSRSHKMTNHRSSKTISKNRKETVIEKADKKKKKKRSHWFRHFIMILLLFFAVIFFLPKNENGFWTVAVFGVDSRDDNLEQGAHSDVIMLCSLNRATGEIKLVSVYRDTYLKTDRDGEYGKINSAYFDGGHEQAIASLEENLDLKIDDYATFSWAAVADAISILGGVDVEITDSEFEYINAFITETVESTGLGSVHLEQPGLNHLDGVQAVAYARLRLMDTDYKRTARQRLILSLTVEKAKQAGFSTLSDLVMSVLPQTSTSIDISDILSLAKHIDRYYLGENTGFPFSRGDARIHKQSCVIPLTLESNVIQLHQFLYGTEDYMPSASVRKISNQIASDSGMGEVTENAPEISAGSSSGESSTSEYENSLQPETSVDTSTESTEETLEEETLAEETQASDVSTGQETDIEFSDGPSASLEESTEAESGTENHTFENTENGPGMNELSGEESSSPIEIPNGPGLSDDPSESVPMPENTDGPISDVGPITDEGPGISTDPSQF